MTYEKVCRDMRQTQRTQDHTLTTIIYERYYIRQEHRPGNTQNKIRNNNDDTESNRQNTKTRKPTKETTTNI